MWYYKGEEFTSDDIGEYIGFVYCITDLSNGMKYIGKKGLKSTRKLPPLKGQKRRRTKIIETDWQTYYGSSEEVKNLVEEFGGERFKREIIHLCKTKGEMSYVEMYYQITTHALLKPDEYYNAFIGGKIHRKHIKHIDPSKIEIF